ncbi:MAG: site-specific DNA-methyltransferase [Desulfomonile tiedjei]|nr:site-specific DNA-methyltransferase [Desulfomonile tiedjei]
MQAAQAQKDSYDTYSGSILYPRTAAFHGIDCRLGMRWYDDESIDNCITDPPFGIRETKLRKAHNRNSQHVVDGYCEAPTDPAEYHEFTRQWMTEVCRILRPRGSLVVVNGRTPLVHTLVVAEELKLKTINHIIFKRVFGMPTTRHFRTEHYHVLWFSKTDKPTFNTHCRFGPQEKDEHGLSLLYRDLCSVWTDIPVEYRPEEEKNENKLPNALLRKLLLYLTKIGEIVLDPFCGNYTTAYEALALGRRFIGFEVNANIWHTHLAGEGKALNEKKLGWDLPNLKQVQVIKPAKQGQRWDPDEEARFYVDYLELRAGGMKKGEAIQVLCERYERGRFSLDRKLKGLG